MTISRAFSAKGVGDKLTSGDANQVDTNTTYALDKRSGQTDTLASVVSCSGAGRILPSYVGGADADTTYQMSSGISVIDASVSLTASRTYTLSTTGASTGDTVMVIGSHTQTVTVKVGATTLLEIGPVSGATVQTNHGVFRYTGTTWALLDAGYDPPATSFSANGTYTVPQNVYKLLIIGCGGGGGGGGGNGGGTLNSAIFACGGGGGGAATAGIAFVTTTPGTSYTVTVGTGGTGGAGGASATTALSGTVASSGNNGTSTTFGSVVSFRGGQGGVGPTACDATALEVYAPGGGPLQGGTRSRTVRFTSLATAYYQIGVRIPGEGGYGGISTLSGGNAAAAGAYPSVSATLGGSGNTIGGNAGSAGTNTSYPGGGGGGGGGASMFGSGGNGGNGGTAESATSAAAGSNGSAGTAGSGGGGGGAGGNTSNTLNVGGTGGTGGNGILLVIPIR